MGAYRGYFDLWIFWFNSEAIMTNNEVSDFACIIVLDKYPKEENTLCMLMTCDFRPFLGTKLKYWTGQQ